MNQPAQPKGPFVLGVLIIIIGLGWLLMVRGFLPGIDWIWTLGLGAIGVLAFVLSGGIDKASIMTGPFFLAASLLSVLRQTGRLDLNTEVPILVILIGILVLIAQHPSVRPPRWYLPATKNRPGD